MRTAVAVILLALVCTAGFTQETKLYVAESAHYRVSVETSQSQADEVARRMEAALRLANDIFHFDLALLPAKMRVRLFRDEAAFNAYLKPITAQTRTDFVFLAYPDPEKSELLCFPRAEKAFSASLIHQAVVQLCRSYIQNMPLWMREGVAAYLEASVWDAKNSLYLLRPNLVWLEPLRAAVRGETALVPLADLLMFTREAAQAELEIFYPEAWGLVYFLANSDDRAHNRILWDAITCLGATASLEDNSQAVRTRVFGWLGADRVFQDFKAYVLSMKNANDLAREGADRYAQGDLDGAETALLASVDLDPSGSVALYYLGLVAYGRTDYAKAEDWYLRAYEAGAGAGLINYALGVNAFAAGKYDTATKYLRLARDADPSAYAEKVDALLTRLEGQR
jgi:tetratricopeptide (TPR) repeat protein